MHEQTEEVSKIRWILAYALSDIPPWGACRVVEADAENIIQIDVPNHECQFVVVNGEYAIKAGSYGLVTKDSPAVVLCSEPPMVDVPFGPYPGSFILRKGGQ